MRKYGLESSFPEESSVRLNQLLEQEGQPCSYCIAVYLLLHSGEKLSVKESVDYGRHLAKEHANRTFWIEP